MKTLVICPSTREPAFAAIAGVLRSTPSFGDPTTASFESVESYGFQTSADLAVLVMSGNAPRGFEVLRRLRQKFAGPVLAVGGIGDAKVILRAMQSGADLYLDETDLTSDLTAALGRLLQRPEANTNLGRLVCVLAASGGCGVSTLAVNSAVLMAAEQGRALLVDLQAGRGDLSALLDLAPQFSVADVCAHEARLDQAMFEKMLASHACGLRLLAASPDADGRPHASGIGRALALARTLFPDTVVDLGGGGLRPEYAEVVEKATNLFVVCRFDFTSVRATRRLLDQIDKRGLPRNRVRLVVNHFGLPNELGTAEAEAALGARVAAFVPHDPKVPEVTAWAEWHAVLHEVTAGRRNRVGEAEYKALHSALLSALRAAPPKAEWRQQMEAVAEPWVSLRSLSRLDERTSEAIRRACAALDARWRPFALRKSYWREAACVVAGGGDGGGLLLGAVAAPLDGRASGARAGHSWVRRFSPSFQNSAPIMTSSRAACVGRGRWASMRSSARSTT